jgi:hypothetical protein
MRHLPVRTDQQGIDGQQVHGGWVVLHR